MMWRYLDNFSSGAVCMVPVTAEGKLLLVTQYRHAAGKRLLELPAGTLEPGEPPLDAVARELQEEVGQLPGKIESIGGFYVAPGYTTEYIHLFICSNSNPACSMATRTKTSKSRSTRANQYLPP
jgi:ADP-ribose pyrophosphatase